MISSVRGTKDILPEEMPIWYFIEKTLQEVSSLFGFKEIRLPIFEKTEVFQRSIGEATDVVRKEMYTFVDRGGDSITLRPELTASVVRAVIQHNLLSESPLLRLWYYGPLFRYERPQKGRLRQFHQYGAEIIGSSHPEADVEILLLANSIIKKLGISEYTLLINSLGNLKSRLKYREILVSYLKQHSNELSVESRERLGKNPLRVLDSKDPNDLEIIQNSPLIYDFLDEESKEHYNNTKMMLKEYGISFKEYPYLVRGLDYYSHTVFEFQSSFLGSQDAFGGGGRYNELFTQFSQKNDIPSIGFALGIERIVLILESQGIEFKQENPKVFVAYNDSKFIPKVLEIAQKLREFGISTIFDLQRRSLKAQLKDANKKGVSYTIIIGEEEINNQTISIKNMQDGNQFTIEIRKGIEFLINELK
ncbi:MAG: histidine--tRNA ligase [Ignavibacteria bacterium]|nr:histidine--tRNA ligase [Ignavibacteria bacterium]